MTVRFDNQLQIIYTDGGRAFVAIVDCMVFEFITTYAISAYHH